MRDIKFRGKLTDDDEWVYGAYMAHDYDGHTIFNQNLGDGTLQGFEVIPETVGQYTGLKDRNGVKIYEGDKLKGLGYVVWDESECRYLIDIIGERYEVFFNELSQNELEVIGNIHDDIRDNL